MELSHNNRTLYTYTELSHNSLTLRWVGVGQLGRRRVGCVAWE